MNRFDKTNECYWCKFKRDLKGEIGIACINPDSEMDGTEYGTRKGWFNYPQKFDPFWKIKYCKNFTRINEN
jgi:hypothetical protein